MPTPILATKLFIPPPRPKAVLRPRLIERLNEGLHRKLTLISAPAGFGKTTLISEWLAAESTRAQMLPPHSVAWLSLDEADSDPTRFLSYLIAALQTIAPKLGEGVMAVLQPSPPAPVQSILTPLLNEIALLRDKLVLVLDDYHVIDAQAVDAALTFLLEHLPPAMHIVITTREDPPLPLARYRARGQMTEVRATDLRFTPAEAAEFLHQVMGLDLTTAEVDALDRRTEGWVAGLQLAALSMQGRKDVAGFVKAFAGDHRYVVDYLVEEVLQRQPEQVRDFLRQTSILDRLSGPLCDAVTNQRDSITLLDTLERSNLFVVPLDDQRQWFRYHHLFADVLAAHLRQEHATQIPLLHQRASVWYEQHGAAVDAIRHALVAEDFARAANLIELALPTVRRNRQEAMLLSWLQSLPEEVLHFRPILNVQLAGTSLSMGQMTGFEARLRDAELWLETSADAERHEGHPIVVDKVEFQRLPGWLAIYRAGYALAQGDLPATMHQGQAALALVTEEDTMGRGAAAALMGLATWAAGDLETAYQTYAEGMASVQKAGFISDGINSTIALADIRVTQGRLHEAMRAYERGLQLAIAPNAPILRGAADMYVGMSELQREFGDLDAATQLLLKSKELGEHLGMPQNPYRWRVAMARIRQTQGDLEGAYDLLQEAERHFVSDFFPNVRPFAAIQTRLWVAQGRLGEALNWAGERGLSANDDLTYLREFEHITLARVLLAQAKHDPENGSLLEASEFLTRLLQAAEAGGRLGSAIEILVLLALVDQIQGDLPAALAYLARALTLAAPQGYCRIFADEGISMAHLLSEASAHGIMPAYATKLLAATAVDQPKIAAETPIPTFPTAQPLIEPLSQRELDVLRLFQSELSGPEIADRLVVALSTVRTHTKGIYSKLNVNSRRAAVNRAIELNLL